MYATPTTTLVATPAYDHKLDIACAAAFFRLYSKGYIKEHVTVCGDGDVRHARNQIVSMFLASPLDNLIFVDTDIGFSLSDWDALTGDYDELAVCGLYAKKQSLEEPAYGLGFCRLHRKVLESLITNVPVYNEGNTTRYDLFSRTPSTEWYSESIQFWRQVESAKFAVKTFQSPTLVHYGRHGFVLKTVSVPL